MMKMINRAVPDMMAEQQNKVEARESNPGMLKKLFKLLARKILGVDFDQNKISPEEAGRYFYPGMTEADQQKIINALQDVNNGRNMDEAQGILYNAKNMVSQAAAARTGVQSKSTGPFGINTSLIGSGLPKKDFDQAASNSVIDFNPPLSVVEPSTQPTNLPQAA